jgi:hypothetical protein
MTLNPVFKNQNSFKDPLTDEQQLQSIQDERPFIFIYRKKEALT